MFKTIHECRVELVGHTTMAGSAVGETWPESARFLPVSAARASFGREDKTGDDYDADLKLMKFLADHRHVSCFEHNYATFLVECPLFVRSQIMRHKSFSFNEISRRYTSEQIEFWIPDKWRKQSKSNKQASTDDEILLKKVRYPVMNPVGYCIGFEDTDPITAYKSGVRQQYQLYTAYVDGLVCREQARAILPQSLLTRFYMTGNLRSWWSFLSSRTKPDTQVETRVVAERIQTKLTELWPEAMKALMQ